MLLGLALYPWSPTSHRTLEVGVVFPLVVDTAEDEDGGVEENNGRTKSNCALMHDAI